MSAYGFRSYWEPKLMDGSKKTTLRIDRKDGRAPKVGEKFSAFVGMRTKQCRRLFDSETTKVERIEIHPQHGESEFEPMNYAIWRDGRLLNMGQATAFAVDDGFINLESFLTFFEVHHSIQCRIFRGWLITWKPVKPS